MRLMGMLVLQVSGHKLKFWTNERKSQEMTCQQASYFHGNPPNSCRDFGPGMHDVSSAKVLLGLIYWKETLRLQQENDIIVIFR